MLGNGLAHVGEVMEDRGHFQLEVDVRRIDKPLPVGWGQALVMEAVRREKPYAREATVLEYRDSVEELLHVLGSGMDVLIHVSQEGLLLSEFDWDVEESAR